MLAKVSSCALVGLEGAIVQVEADLNPNALPGVMLVGLPDMAFKESTERVWVPCLLGTMQIHPTFMSKYQHKNTSWWFTVTRLWASC